MANRLMLLYLALLIVPSVKCQDISGHNPFSGKTVNKAMSNDKTMQEILAKLQLFEIKNIDQVNMINQFHTENVNIQNSMKQLQKENVNLKDSVKKEKVNLQNGMKQLQKENVNLQDGMKQLQKENVNLKDSVKKEKVNLQNGMKQLQKENVNLQDGMKQLQKENVNLQDSVRKENVNLHNGMKHLQKKNVNLQDGMKQLQKDNVNLQNGMKQLQKENVNLKHGMQMVNSKQDKDLKQIKGLINSQQNNLTDMKKATEDYVVTLGKVAGIHEQCLDHFEKQNSFVSFTAYAAAIRDYNQDDVVQFDVFVVNYGGYYNDSTSIFTCPYSGYYTFSVSLLANSADLMAVDIMLSGIKLVGARAYDVDTNGAASTTATVKCESGQQVWVRCRGDGQKMHGNENRYSSFTGTLLRVL